MVFCWGNACFFDKNWYRFIVNSNKFQKNWQKVLHYFGNCGNMWLVKQERKKNDG